MAIGPESWRQASGRIVVVAAVFAALGSVAVMVGIGPLVQSSQSLERGMGVTAILLGAVMITAGGSLGLRRGPARLLGVAGGVAMMALGGGVALASAASLGMCGSAGDQAIGCLTVVGGVGTGGVLIVVAAAASMIVVTRARPASLRRSRRPSRPH